MHFDCHHMFMHALLAHIFPYLVLVHIIKSISVLSNARFNDTVFLKQCQLMIMQAFVTNQHRPRTHPHSIHHHLRDWWRVLSSLQYGTRQSLVSLEFMGCAQFPVSWRTHTSMGTYHCTNPIDKLIGVRNNVIMLFS